jgi:hypothetical protein
VATSFQNRLNILADLWLNYRDDEDFEDFISYNDIGLPMAFALSEGIVKGTKKSDQFINETFELLLTGLEMEDSVEGYDSLDEILGFGFEE